VEKRTKKLAVILVILLVSAGAYYGYQHVAAKKPAPPRLGVKVGAPLPRGTKPQATPAAPLAVPAPSRAGQPGPMAAQAAAPERQVIKVMEKGREVQYGSPEDFLSKTTLSPAEIAGFSHKKLDEARKGLDAARAKGDKAATDRAMADVKLAERIDALVKARALEAPEKTFIYSSLGKRDPFMSPLEVPKVFPPVSPNAKPLERVPAESLALKAIIWNEKGYRALIMTPDGRGYTVKVGDAIGNKQGRIVKITENRVYVTEHIHDILGNVEANNIVLQLHKEAD
jgi:Tfp pilus assembly protein PilP